MLHVAECVEMMPCVVRCHIAVTVYPEVMQSYSDACLICTNENPLKASIKSDFQRQCL